MTLAELCAGVELRDLRGPLGVELEGLACDSREIRPGWGFVALKGEKVDGSAFVPAVLAGGLVGLRLAFFGRMGWLFALLTGLAVGVAVIPVLSRLLGKGH